MAVPVEQVCPKKHVRLVAGKERAGLAVSIEISGGGRTTGMASLRYFRLPPANGRIALDIYQFDLTEQHVAQCRARNKSSWIFQLVQPVIRMIIMLMRLCMSSPKLAIPVDPIIRG